MAVYTYLVYCPETQEALLIDPSGHVDDLLETLNEKELTLKYIVNTHGHGDHVGGNAELQSTTGAQIVMHPADDQFFSIPQAQEICRQLGFEPSPRADITVQDGDEIKIGNVTLKVIHTPGHSPGCICLLAEDHLFTGDTLFVGSVGRADLPGSSGQQMLASIRDKILPLPDNTIILPGHAYGPQPTSTIKQEKENNGFIINYITGE